MITRLNNAIGTPYDAVDYHCYSFIEDMIPEAPRLSEVHEMTARSDMVRYIGLFSGCDVVDGCIVTMGDSHVGIYHSGYVYHNSKQDGVIAQPLRTIKMLYSQLAYYQVKPHHKS